MGFDAGLPLPIIVATGIMLFVVLTLYASPKRTKPDEAS